MTTIRYQYTARSAKVEPPLDLAQNLSTRLPHFEPSPGGSTSADLAVSVNAHLEVGERVADHLVLGGEGARPDGVEEGHPVKVGHRLHQLGHRHLGVPLARVVPGV